MSACLFADQRLSGAIPWRIAAVIIVRIKSTANGFFVNRSRIFDLIERLIEWKI